MRRLVLALGAVAAIGVSAVLAGVGAMAAPQTKAVSATTASPVAIMKVTPSMVSVLGDGPNNNCVSTNGEVFTCTMQVRETTASTEPLTWRGTTDGGITATFVPASGTLHPGQTVTVKATTSCSAVGAFIFFTTAVSPKGVLLNGAAVAYSCG